MALEFPHHMQGMQCIQTSENNLSQLLVGKGKDQLITPVAKQAFIDYKNARLGVIHQAKKYTASILAYGATIGVPVLAVGGTVYYAFKDYIHDPSKLTTLIWNNYPIISSDNSVVGSLAPYTTPVTALSTFAGVMAVDFALKKATGFAPIQSVSKWTVGMISTALVYAAYKAGEITTSSYEQEEEEKTNTRKNLHIAILEQLKTTYDDIAEGLFARFQLSSHSPKELVELKNTVVQLQKRFPYIRSQLAKLDLKPSEIESIMDRLVSVTKKIKEQAFDLRMPVSEADNQYNAELLAVLSDKEFASNAISKDIKNDAQIVNNNSLGVMHTIKSYATAATLGLGSAAAIQTVASAILVAGSYFSFSESWDHISICAKTFNTSSCISEAAVIGLMSIAALAEGVDVAKRVHNSFVKERAIADERKAKHEQHALNKLVGIYNGVANYLLKQREVATTPEAKNKLKADEENILAKVPAIKKQVAKLGVTADPSIVTKKLENMIASPTNSLGIS